MPDTVEEIADNAFANCPKLSKIVLGRNVTSIAENALNNSNNTVIYCYYGSYAYDYARNREIPYILLDGIKLGDANGDGHVNINDVTLIQRYKADMETLEGINFHAADVDGEGIVSIEDATILQRYFAEYDDITYLIGEVMTQ